MYRFNDPYGIELEVSLLGRLDFPVYLALACLLIHKICHEDYNNINLRYL